MRTSRREFVSSTVIGAMLAGGMHVARAASVRQAAGPEETAVLLASFESAGDLTSLLAYLHKDAAAIIPPAAIVGWYRDVWFPTGPGPITVTGTTIHDWTWAVNGVSYRGTAEVAFVQTFADGSTVSDVVRLVKYDGVWHWFFGRDRDFVNAQIAAYAPDSPLLTAASARAASASQSGDTAPYGVTALAGLSEDAFLALAPDVAGRIARSPRVPERSSVSGDGRAANRMITYYNDPDGELYPVGVVGTVTLADGNDELAYLEALLAPVRGEGGGMIAPEVLQSGVDSGVHYQMQTEFASAAVGNATNLYFTTPGNGIVYVIGAVEMSNLAALAEAMVSGVSRRGA